MLLIFYFFFLSLKIFRYIAWLNLDSHTSDIFLATVKFTFIKIITDYQYYIPLNLPHEISLSNSPSQSTMVKNFWTKHFFAGLLVREVRAGLLQKQRIREQSISTLRRLLQAHDTDSRYFHPIVKQRIAGLYFPFVITTLEFHQVLNEYLGYEEKVNWLLCFFYIVENCNRELLHEWWQSCSTEKHLEFFIMLEMGTDVFKDKDLFKTMAFVMMDMILDFVIHFEEKLSDPSNTVLSKIFSVMQQLQLIKSVEFEFMRGYYSLLILLSSMFSNVIFK